MGLYLVITLGFGAIERNMITGTLENYSSCIYFGVIRPQAWQEGHMVTRAGSVPQVQLPPGPVQPGRDGGEDQGMGEGSVAWGGDDCCSMV